MTMMKPIIFATHNSIETIYPPPGCELLECKEVSHLLETMSIHSLSHYRQHLSTLLVFLRFDEYGEYFFLCLPLFHYISEERHFTHVGKKSLSPFLASLPLLYSASSAPTLMSRLSGRSCARSSHSSCPPSGDSSLLGGIVNSSPLLIPSYIKNTVLQASSDTDRSPVVPPLSVFRWSGAQVTGEIVLDGGGQFIPAGIFGLHT